MIKGDIQYLKVTTGDLGGSRGVRITLIRPVSNYPLAWIYEAEASLALSVGASK